MAENNKKAAASSDKAKKPGGFVRFFKRAGKFFRDCFGEIKRIVWPTPRSTFKSTGVVLVVVTAVCLFVFGLDQLFMRLLSLVMNISL